MFRSLPYILYFAICFSVYAAPAVQSDDDLVEIQEIDPTILVELKYATTDNLTGRILYPEGFKARLRRGVALQLREAQNALRPLGAGLKIWDAYRPIEVQKALYDVVNNPSYVASPGVESMHNRGVAVDVTLVDLNGREKPMPTKFDVIHSSATFFYKGGNPAILKNLVLLQRVMSQNGFYACRTEWWHFFSRKWQKYPNVLDEQSPSDKRIRP